MSNFSFYYTCMNNSNYLRFFTGLINVHTIKLIRHKNDSPHGIVIKTDGIFISILFSLLVQLFFIDKLSLQSSVTFVIHI